MAYVLPFRSWFSLTPRVFNLRTMRALSTDPTRVLSYTFTPPQWLSPNRVVSHRKLRRHRFQHKTPRLSPQPFSMHKQRHPFFHRKIFRRLKDFALSFKRPILRVWLPSRWCLQPLPLKVSFNFRRSWASLFRAFFRFSDANQVSQICSVLALCYQTHWPSSGASTISVRPIS
jgi:hypothetical protein